MRRIWPVPVQTPVQTLWCAAICLPATLNSSIGRHRSATHYNTSSSSSSTDGVNVTKQRVITLNNPVTSLYTSYSVHLRLSRSHTLLYGTNLQPKPVARIGQPINDELRCQVDVSASEAPMYRYQSTDSTDLAEYQNIKPKILLTDPQNAHKENYRWTFTLHLFFKFCCMQVLLSLTAWINPLKPTVAIWVQL